MTDGLFPPLYEPGGPTVDDPGVVQAFLRQEQPAHSRRLHIEGPALLADREIPAALWVSPSTVLVRRDLPEETEPARSLIERTLAAEGLERLDEETVLAVPVALQLLGIRLSSWDLWGTDVDDAFAAVRRAAVGESGVPWGD